MLKPLPVTDVMRNGYADLQESVEYAAHAVAILAVESQLNLTVTKRSAKNGGGYDYYLGSSSVSENFLASEARLEVTGTLSHARYAIYNTVTGKQKRLNVPRKTKAYIVGVDFRRPYVILQEAY